MHNAYRRAVVIKPTRGSFENDPILITGNWVKSEAFRRSDYVHVSNVITTSTLTTTITTHHSISSHGSHGGNQEEESQQSADSHGGLRGRNGVVRAD